MKAADRYSRQVRFAPIGEAGQGRLAAARVGVVGLGALGTVAADQLVRAGVGLVRMIDRDFVEVSNLQRQTLYDEEDARNNLPKAVAAERKLRRINSTVRIEGVVDDLNGANVEDWLDGVDLVLDGLDNFETRFVLNDACRKTATPWIYAAAVSGYGLVLPILPETSCLRCAVASLPAPGSAPTCDTAGVIAPATNVVGSLAVGWALRWICGALPPADVRLTTVDVWSMRFQSIRLPDDDRRRCPVCAEGRFDYLGSEPLRTVSLCGRNAVQIIPAARADLDLPVVERHMGLYGAVEANEFLLKCSNPPYELTLFRDGRAIVKGTEEPAVARALYAKMVGI